MAKISFSDVLFVTISVRGRVLGNFRLDGVNSYSEILGHIMQWVRGVKGMANIDVRNSSQGWTARRSLMVA